MNEIEAGTKPNILIVDDVAANLMLFKIVLRVLDVNLIAAESGAEALRKIQGQEIALALLDIQMPEMDGIELAKRIQSDNNMEIVPIIFITAHEKNEKELEECYAAGAVDFILKPFKKNILLSKAKIFSELFRQKHQIEEQKLKIEHTANEVAEINQTLNKRLIYENLLSKISGLAVSVDNIEMFSESSLAALGESFDVSRAYIIEYNHQTDTIKNVQSWSNKGIVSPNEYKHLVTSKLLKYWNGFLTRGEILSFESIDDIRDEDTKKLLRAQNILSILLCPLFVGDLYYGFIGFDCCSKRHEWPKQDVAFLQSISRIIASAIERKQAENILIINETKYRTMLNASPDGIFLVSLRGIITEASEIGLELLEVPNKDELIGQHFFRMVPVEEKNLVKSIISRTLEEGLAQNIEIKIIKKSDKLFLSETSITLIQNADREPLSFLITLRDISHRKKLEQQQINADRLASLGEMATGIAHEINQPLNIISLTLDNIVFEAEHTKIINKDFLVKKTSRIFENIDRMKNIIDHVRAFSRNQNDFILSEFDINESIKNALSMISEQLRHNGIDLKLSLAKNLPLIVGNTFKFEQVILNLLSNAKDTLLEKSEIEQNNYQMSILIKSYMDKGALLVEVTDNGMGINSEDAKLVMLPFYSTKDTGKGTGLGLSISHQIIKEMKGNFDVETKINHGATFKIGFNINSTK